MDDAFNGALLLLRRCCCCCVRTAADARLPLKVELVLPVTEVEVGTTRPRLGEGRSEVDSDGASAKSDSRRPSREPKLKLGAATALLPRRESPVVTLLLRRRSVRGTLLLLPELK